MGCKKYICENDDPCGSPTAKDDLNDKAPETETVTVSQGDTFPPPKPRVFIGYQSWTVKQVLGQDITATKTSSKVEPSIELNNQKIPGKVKDHCIKKLKEGEGESLLQGVSDEDAKAKFVAEATTADWNKVIDACIGYNKGKHLSGGASYGQPVLEKTVTIGYYAQAFFEGCEEGTAEQFSDSETSSPCGYGRWEITGPLYWERPQNPSVYSNYNVPQPYNPLGDQSTWTLQMEEARANGNVQWFQQLNSVPSNQVVTLHAQANGSDGGSNGFKIGLGDIEFGPVNVYAYDPDMGNNSVELKVNAALWDIPAWTQSTDPAASMFYGVARSASMQVGFVNCINQAPYMAEAYNQFRQEIGPVIQSFVNTFNPLMQAHTSQQVTIIQQVQQIITQAPAAPGQAVETASIVVNGGNVKTSTEVRNVGGGGRKGDCWLARAAYGEQNPEWQKFRKYIYNIAPKWQKDIYVEYAPRLANYAKRNDIFRKIVKSWMNTKIRNIPA